jgi:hypothetical protein
MIIPTTRTSVLYWGNGSLFYVKLNPDMISYSGDIVTVPQSVESFGGSRENFKPGVEFKDMFVEGPWFYKRNGKYYMMFAGMEKGGEVLSYSVTMDRQAHGVIREKSFQDKKQTLYQPWGIVD